MWHRVTTESTNQFSSGAVTISKLDKIAGAWEFVSAFFNFELKKFEFYTVVFRRNNFPDTFPVVWVDGGKAWRENVSG